ncbi:SDR family NAD(P)-dependent oxidoreductase [Achromobacter sp. KS-M25]|nr:SDR family NAD(P)-dependent oxidoreductase [Achromobacter aestuarii]
MKETHIVITGATGGIGAALAIEYAAPGVTLFLHGRRHNVLSNLADVCRIAGAAVETKAFDIRDHEQLHSWLDEISLRFELDIVFANAGVNINIGPQSKGETWNEIQGLFDINLRAVLATVQAVLPAMRARGKGQIVLMSSLAAYRGLPMTPSYSASKAAIKAYGEGLRDWLAPEGVKVNVVMPGYVESKMCREMPGPKPFLMQPEQAAKLIRRKVAKNRPRISFPFPLNLGCWLLSVIHPSLSSFILRRMKYGA